MNFLADLSCRAANVIDLDTFYDKATEIFKKGSLENSTVLDIGCGFGFSSTKLLKLFPGIKKIIAIDKDIESVLEARKLFPDDKIEFQYGNIELGSQIFTNVWRSIARFGSCAIKSDIHSFPECNG
ncbi:hypothetical protein TNCV_4497611 [Trichonephila clavipes]|nr:hypothetical protein TNCV_4497611 [Trichonephila clavipes]